jgi:hypothetical protein
MDNIFKLIEASRYRLTEGRTLKTIAGLSQDQGYCDAGVNYLARAVGASERAVQLALRKLEADGVLEIEYRVGRYFQNHYRINHERLIGGGANIAPHGEVIAPHGEVIAPHGEVIAPHGEVIAPGVVKKLRGGGEKTAPNLLLSINDLTDDSRPAKADPSYLPEYMQRVKTLVDQFNLLPSVHKMSFQKREWKGEYAEGSPFQKLVKFTENADWELQWEQFKDEYKNSSFLQKGGEFGNLNHASWLFKPENFAKVLSGQYRNKKSGLETFQVPSNYNSEGKSMVDLSEDDLILKQWGYK